MFRRNNYKHRNPFENEEEDDYEDNQKEEIENNKREKNNKIEEIIKKYKTQNLNKRLEYIKEKINETAREKTNITSCDNLDNHWNVGESTYWYDDKINKVFCYSEFLFDSDDDPYKKIHKINYNDQAQIEKEERKLLEKMNHIKLAEELKKDFDHSYVEESFGGRKFRKRKEKKTKRKEKKTKHRKTKQKEKKTKHRYTKKNTYNR
jgi:hypothetical protein